MGAAFLLCGAVGALRFALCFARSPASASDAQIYAQLSGSSSSSSSVRSSCAPIPSSFSLCHGVGYRDMRVPNLLDHGSLREAQQQSASWLPLVSKLCHRDTRKFLCSLFAPVCLAELSGGTVLPCRALCEAVRDGCVPVMSAFGFPWPDMFNCSRFPQGTELCVPQTATGGGGGEMETPTHHHHRTAQEATRKEEEASKGTVICDACSLAAEGETDVQDNFCKSPYAFKLRLGSVSVVGGDRQLVPLGRSRILRWAGGGAEGVGAGGAMAHNALWLPEGGACVCPGLDDAAMEDGGGGGGTEEQRRRRNSGRREDVGKKVAAPPVAEGWYLGLAKAEEGRLVLSRLVRWTREDRELKRFIRALLRQPCSQL